MLPRLLLTGVLALLAAACGGTGDPLGPEGGTAPPAPTSQGASDAVTRLGQEDLDDFGCGYGFTVGTPDQTVRLSVFSQAGHGDAPEPRTVELGGDWTGQLVVGQDLFAQWCDDVIEADEPEVVEHDSWEVTGTLTWELVEGDGQCPSVATATLTDAEVVTDDAPVELPPVLFTNEFLGCFAG